MEMNNEVETVKARRDRLAAIHIAEYSALTNRITYYVTLQYATWGIAAGLFGYLASLWWKVPTHQNLEWLGLICILAVSWAVLHINYEFAVIVLYLLEQLLPRMGTDSAVELNEVLGFERWLKKLGAIEDFHRDQAPFIPFLVGAAMLLFLLGKGVFYTHWSYSDTRWTFVAGSVFLIVCLKVWRLDVLRRRIKALLDA